MTPDNKMNLNMTRLSRIALLGFIATFLPACDTSDKALPQTGSAPGHTGVVLSTSSDPRVVFDGNGNAIAVWSQFDGARKNIWANRYTAASGWGAPQLIETNGGDVDFPKIAINANGSALVVWEQTDATRRNIWVNRYDTVRQAWGTAQLLETDNAGFAIAPQVAIDANGNGMAVWQQFDGVRNNIWANRYDAATGKWEECANTSGVIVICPKTIENEVEDADSPQIAVDGNGNFMAVWRSQAYDKATTNQYNSAHNRRYNLWGSRHAAGSGWAAPRLISDNTVLMVNGSPDLTNPVISGNADTPHIAMDAVGNAMAVWVQSNHLYANRYDVALNQWTVRQGIDQQTLWTAAAPQIAMNAAGNAILVWEQYFDVDPHDGIPAWKNIRASRYSAATRLWGAPQFIETNDTGHALAPQIAMDTLGNAMVVWQQWDDTQTQYSVWANRYDALLGWDFAELAEDIGSGDALPPYVAVDGAGNATAVWAQHDNKGVRNRIYANRHTAGVGWGVPGLIEAQ